MKEFFARQDIEKIMHCKRSKSYKIISELNKELRERGYMTYQGLVPSSYFKKRFGINAIKDNMEE